MKKILLLFGLTMVIIIFPMHIRLKIKIHLHFFYIAIHSKKILKHSHFIKQLTTGVRRDTVCERYSPIRQKVELLAAIKKWTGF